MLELSWENIPEPILLRVLSFLAPEEICRAGCVCARWFEISEDNILWRGLIRRRFRIRMRKLKIRDSCLSWKNEYRRMVDLTPSVCSQELKVHTDEVLHVAFSNSGENFVTCSKDTSVVVWNLSDNLTATLHQQVDMKLHNWMYSWASKYNSTDSLLLVAGVVSEIDGEIAVFKVDKQSNEKAYSILCRVSNNPYDVMGDWASQTHFFSGRLTLVPGSVWPTATLYMCEADPTISPDTPSLNNNIVKNIVLRLQDENTNYLRCLHITNKHTVNQSVAPQSNDRVEVGEPQDVDPGCSRVLEENNICLVFLTNSSSLAPHEIGFCWIKPENLSNIMLARTPDRVIEFGGHIVGLSLSPDHRFLFVNVRRWPTNATLNPLESPVIAREIEMRVVELETLTLLETVYSGHKGFTDSMAAFYIYIDVGRDLVASGSEDCTGRIWDRYYGCCLSELPHGECVNAAVFCPTNQQLLVSVSDDQSVKVWKSKALTRVQDTPTFTVL